MDYTAGSDHQSRREGFALSSNDPQHQFVAQSMTPRRNFAGAFLVRCTLVAGLLWGMAAWGAELTDLASAKELKRLTFEELLDQEVSIVSRRHERLSSTPSAVQVITYEEIRRSGATSLPEALRLASNLQVAQVDSRQWAIDARGFNNTLANKLLVMIDGRTVYTPLFAGVFWDVQHTLLEDIERIEVVSGPGAALWGANAVNGVINIVTKSAKNTQGLFLQGGAGSFLQDFGAIRYGGSSGSNLFFRVYGQRFDHNETVFSNGRDATNAWDMTQGGFRADWIPDGPNVITVQGDLYSGTFEQPGAGGIAVDGQNILGRWTRTISAESELIVQLYIDRTWRRVPGVFAEDLKTYDLDFQHRFAVGERHGITWGGGYRLMMDQVRNSQALAFLPGKRNLQLFSAFLQDDIVLVPDRLRLVLGSKVEHNDFSGFELEPSARLAWTPTERQAVWAAVSRAVRSPSRIDSDFFVPAPPVPAGTNRVSGSDNFNAEKVLAFELGYRFRPLERATVSLAGFYNFYDDIRSLEPAGSNHFVIRNRNHAESWGVELSGRYQVTDWWRLRGGYTWLRKQVSREEGGLDLNQGRAEGNDAEHQFLLQSMVDLPYGFQFDAVARYVDPLPSPAVPSYFTVDARLAWWPAPNLELSVVGQNLVENRHAEFGAAGRRHEIPRSVFGKISWWF